MPVVALAGCVAGVADEAVHVGDGHAEGGAGLRDDVIPGRDAAEVVGAVFESDLPDLRARRQTPDAGGRIA